MRHFARPWLKGVRKLSEKQQQHAHNTPENKLLTECRRLEDSEITSGDTGRTKPQTQHYGHQVFYLPVQEGATTLTVHTSNIFIYRKASKTTLFFIQTTFKLIWTPSYLPKEDL